MTILGDDGVFAEAKINVPCVRNGGRMENENMPIRSNSLIGIVGE